MNALTILNKTIRFVTFKMHKTRQKALLDCVKSLLAGNAATVTAMGRGIASKAFEKHRIKRADRLLSNNHLQQEIPDIYAVICKLFCVAKHPVIAVDWTDLDDHKGHFLLRASMVLKGRPITLYQEVHSNATKEKAKTHRRFLGTLHSMLGKGCQPIVSSLTPGSNPPGSGPSGSWVGTSLGGCANRTYTHLITVASGNASASCTRRQTTAPNCLPPHSSPNASPLPARWCWSNTRTKAGTPRTRTAHANNR